MKLSKDELIYLLRGVGTEWGSIEDAFRAEHVIDALEKGTLEIEGYERKDHLRDTTKMADEWTKFDSCKGDTHPPKEKFLAWGLPDPDCDGTPTEFFCWRDDFGFSCNESAYPEIHFWRPRPNPPQESEAGK